jgi:glucosamine-6-phosphate deaminase
MEVIIQSSPEEACRIAARIVANRVRQKPDCVLGLATGSTPLQLYAELIRMHREEGLKFSGVTSFNLDEYVGLPGNHPASYARFMKENLFQHIDIPPESIHIPDGMASDIPVSCASYENSIRSSGGIDVQVLGIGRDGHIGFNEPTSSLASRTRIKTLTRRTREDNARFFDSPDEVPRHAITMGIETIMEARECVLLAFGAAKAAAVGAVVEGPVSAMVPGSILQMHPATCILLDDEAAADLQRKEYYQYVYVNKPEWQRI